MLHSTSLNFTKYHGQNAGLTEHVRNFDSSIMQAFRSVRIDPNLRALMFRKLMLYPTELRGQWDSIGFNWQLDSGQLLPHLHSTAPFCTQMHSDPWAKHGFSKSIFITENIIEIINPTHGLGRFRGTS